MCLDDILHDSPEGHQTYSGMNWLDNVLEESPELHHLDPETAADGSYNVRASDGTICRYFPVGPNNPVAYWTRPSSVHQTYPRHDQSNQSEAAQVRAAQEFRHMYMNPGRPFTTSSTTGTTPAEPFRASTNRATPSQPFTTSTTGTTPGHRLDQIAPTPRQNRTHLDIRSNQPTVCYENFGQLGPEDEIELLRPTGDIASTSTRLSNPTDIDTEPKKVERTFLIKYRFHLPWSNPSPSKSHKRKPSGIEIPKTKPINSVPGKLSIRWDLADYDVPKFKNAVIAEIFGEDKDLAAFVKNREANEKDLTWYGIILHDSRFKATGNQQLDKPGVFQDWLTACVPFEETRKLVCKVEQLDPKAEADKMNPVQEEEPFVPSTAANDRAIINGLIGQILATHSPCPQLSGSSDKSIFINPEQGDQYFVVTMARADLWAKAINATPQVVDLRTPPKTPAFDYRTGFLDNHDQPAKRNLPAPETRHQCCSHETRHQCCSHNSSGPSIHHVNAGQCSDHGALTQQRPAAHAGHVSNAINITGVSSALTSVPNNPRIESSPAPSDDEDPIDVFLKFARVDVDSDVIRDGLAKLGMTHWKMFHLVTSEELIAAGVPMGPARTLAEAVKRYSKHLKNQSRSNIALNI
ncbi:hypothetical protein PGTUg99_033899 [Puccinia graminis f. sp. tritici]|uniref:Uncharacterized protein n=1 Tax=Puccinia graminis f. sp. tritici TaxID=56615 RepID=A0A5B0N2Y1_PUCGR|nr:hypothetical protein PGTUg99_033899 [Puccinia graminis f. sp. tritici]